VQKQRWSTSPAPVRLIRQGWTSEMDSRNGFSTLGRNLPPAQPSGVTAVEAPFCREGKQRDKRCTVHRSGIVQYNSLPGSA